MTCSGSRRPKAFSSSLTWVSALYVVDEHADLAVAGSRRIAFLVQSSRIRLVEHQVEHHREVFSFGGVVHGTLAELVRDVDVGRLLHQQSDHASLSVEHCVDDSRLSLCVCGIGVAQSFERVSDSVILACLRQAYRSCIL